MHLSQFLLGSYFYVHRVVKTFDLSGHDSVTFQQPLVEFHHIYFLNDLTKKVETRLLVNIIYSKQFGFRACHSTDHAILSILDKIQHALEDGNFSCGIFLDLSKAFDTVSHSILLRKLEYYGIRGVANEWFVSYLTERKQFVSIGQSCSSHLINPCGVPQVRN